MKRTNSEIISDYRERFGEEHYKEVILHYGGDSFKLPKQYSPHKTKAKRDEALYAAYLRGDSWEELSDAFAISLDRVHKICNKLAKTRRI